MANCADWRQRPIESGIRPVVDALNAVDGIRTVASCQGHRSSKRYPFVMFECDAVEKAGQLNAKLFREHAADRLAEYWIVEGHFSDEKLYFTLVAPRLRSERDTLFAWALQRAPMDRGLRLLVNIIHEWRDELHDTSLRRQSAAKRGAQHATAGYCL